MSRDIEKGIGNLMGYESPETKRARDLHYLNKVKQIIERPLEPLGETLARSTPSLNLELKPKEETKEANDFKSQKEYENHLINSPTKQQHEKAFSMGRSLLKVPEAEKNKMAEQWMKGGGRDPKGRSLDQEIKLGKENWLKNQKTVNQLKALKEWAQPTPVGLGNKYKSDSRTPVEKKRDSYNAKVDANKVKAEAGKGGYSPWYERMAAEEAEALNKIKRSTWEQGGRVKPEPKYVNAQDVQNVYDQPKASPLQMKQLHQRLENHNEMTGQFKNLPKEEEIKQKPRLLYNPVKNELEDTNDPNWGNDILNDKK